MPDESQTTTEATETDAEQNPETDERDESSGLKKALEAERKARRDAERRAKALESAEEQRKQADLSEAEKLAARAKEIEAREAALTARQRSLAVRDALAAAIRDAGLNPTVSNERLLKLLDADAIEYDADGEPTNIGTLLKSLAKDEPALFAKRAGSADGGTGDRNTDVQVAPGLERLSAAYASANRRR